MTRRYVPEDSTLRVLCYSFSMNGTYFDVYKGRAIIQGVSRRYPTAEARIRAQVRPRGIYGGKVALR
jgi:hypothetical protein